VKKVLHENLNFSAFCFENETRAMMAAFLIFEFESLVVVLTFSTQSANKEAIINSQTELLE
jgi:hypothetical protein